MTHVERSPDVSFPVGYAPARCCRDSRRYDSRCCDAKTPVNPAGLRAVRLA